MKLRGPRRHVELLNDDIAVLMSNDATSNRDIVLHYRDGSLQHISELHGGCDPVQYHIPFLMVQMIGMLT